MQNKLHNQKGRIPTAQPPSLQPAWPVHHSFLSHVTPFSSPLKSATDCGTALAVSSSSFLAVKDVLVVDLGWMVLAPSYDEGERRGTRSRLISPTSSRTCLIDGEMCGEADGARAWPASRGQVALPAQLRRWDSGAPAADASPLPLRDPEPALSLDVIHWRTMAEKRTWEGLGQWTQALEIRLWWARRALLSLLQHIKHTHPGSPSRPISTDRFLEKCQRGVLGHESGGTYTRLLIRVHRAPTNVLIATVLSRMLAGVRWKFLNV